MRLRSNAATSLRDDVPELSGGVAGDFDVRSESAYTRLMRLSARAWSLTATERKEYETLHALNDKLLRDSAIEIIDGEKDLLVRVLTCGNAAKEIESISGRVFDNANRKMRAAKANAS